MAFIVDSSVFIQLERQGRDPSALSRDLDEPLALAAITASELLTGVLRAHVPQRSLQRSALVESILSSMPVLPFDLRVARVHAEIWAHLAATGQMIGNHDLLIAATALAYGYGVLTLNLREFQRVPGLVVRDPLA